MPTDKQIEIFDAWCNECVKTGLSWEVFCDVVDHYFHTNPEECLKAMNESMLDWDF